MTSVTVSRGDVLAPGVQSTRGSVRQGAPQQGGTCASVPLRGGLCHPWGVGALGVGCPPDPRAPERAMAGSFLGCPFGGAETGLNFPHPPPARADAQTLLLER